MEDSRLVEIFSFILIALYSLCLLLICLFSLGQLHLTFHYLKSKKAADSEPPSALDPLPPVTIQLPVYNEKYVVKRLIEKVLLINYPRHLLQIQVLDDSTDETTSIIHGLVEKFRTKGVQIDHLHRKDRTGFKAGALQNGLSKASGEFIAIFDSDFLPPEDFLIKALPYFHNGEIGMVQTRWGHLNEDYSLLTQVQAFGLNAHFTIEQSGRKAAGSFINFNGTGGIWRKKCIEDAGGWSSDTLTEDLDLSYRAQLRNWKFEYMESLVSPAELPILISAIKTQQFRWNKGAAETGRKLLREVVNSDRKPINKIHAIMHLFNSSVFVFLFLAGVLSIPVMVIKQGNPVYELIFNIGSILLIGFFSIVVFYWIAHRQLSNKTNFFFLFSSFLIVITGLSFHNSKAVIQGLVGYKTSFHRTPKFNIFNRSDVWFSNKYIRYDLKNTGWIEGLFSLYFLSGLILAFYYWDFDLILFHGILFLGFTSVFSFSLFQTWKHRENTVSLNKL